jgi:hypothetical protein
MLSTTSALLSLHYAGARPLLHLPRSVCRARLHRKDDYGTRVSRALISLHLLRVAQRCVPPVDTQCVTSHTLRILYALPPATRRRRECLRPPQFGGPASLGLLRHRKISQEGLSCFRTEWPVPIPGEATYIECPPSSRGSLYRCRCCAQIRGRLPRN